MEFQLRDAFQGPKLPMDVMSLAMAIAEDESEDGVDVDAILRSYVSQGLFLQEVGAFYEQAKAQRMEEWAFHQKARRSCMETPRRPPSPEPRSRSFSLQVENLARVEIPKVPSKEDRVRMATTLLRKRKVLQQQLDALQMVDRVLEVARSMEL